MFEHTHTQIGPSQIVAHAGDEQRSREANTAGERPRRRPASRGRRVGIATAVAVALASGSAAMVTAGGHTAQLTGHGTSAGIFAPLRSVGETSSPFVHRFRALEAHGYVEVACMVDGELMFNPHTGRYAKVRV